MSDTEPLVELSTPPLVAYAFEAVDPTLLGMDPQSWIPTDQVNLARAILALTAVDMTKVVLVVTGIWSGPLVSGFRRMNVMHSAMNGVPGRWVERLSR